MKRWFPIGSAILSLLLLLPVLAMAQATGQINGIVQDSSGAVLPGVTIEVTNAGTGAIRTAVSGADGGFTIPLLQPGVYNVKASLSGFRSAMREGVRVTVTETARVVFDMEVGQLTETVTVTAQATLVETANATRGIVVDEQKVVDLPLNGRNFTQLGTLIPGVVAPPVALGGQSGDATPGGFGNATGGFNVNGMRNQSNNFLMDGATNNDTFNTGFVLRPPPDAIQEFKILTHAFGAEYGRNAGSVVNVVTKSGSNTLSGALWEFNRDDALQARNFFAPRDQPKPELKQNQFGGALGGPIVRNKVFGFGYYEGFRNDSGITNNVVVLSEAQRRGDFSALSTPIRDPLTGAVFPGNIIPSNRLDPAALQLLNDFVPLPNSPGNRYIVSPTVNDVRDQFGMRFDYQLSGNQSLLGRYMRSDTDRTTPRVIAAVDQKSLATLQDFMVSHNYVISSNVINQARFSINRITANPAVTSGLSPLDYGINLANTNPLAAGLPSFAINGFFGGGTSALGDPQQPFVEPREPRVAGGQRPHLDQGPALAEVRPRRPARGDEHRVHQPSERRSHVQRTAQRQCRGRLPARIPLADPRHHHAVHPGRLRLAVRRLFPGRVPRHLAAHAQLRPALRAADAVHRRQRRHHRLPDGATVARSIRTRPPAWSTPGTPAFRAASCRRTRTTSRRACRRPGIRSATARPASAPRSACSTTRSPARATSSRAACCRRRSRR